MKLIRKAGATSNILQVFIQDSSSTVGAGLTGLAFNSGSLTAYYHRDTDTTATAISLVTMTVGTFTSSGFKEIDATNMPGWYQFCPPDAALASGAKSVGFHLKGATNMAPLPIEVDLWAIDPQVATNAGITSLPTTACTINASLLTSGTGTDQLSVTSGRIDVGKALGTAVTLDSNNVLNVSAKYLAGTALTGRDIGASVLLSTGTGTGQLDFTSGVVKANLAQILGTALTETAGQIAAAFKKFFNIATPASTMDHLTLIDTVTTYTGNTPQTGDGYTRLGAPAGASIAADIAALPTAANVKTQVVNALTTDTYAEPSAVPAATSSLKDKIAYLFTKTRNKSTQTATTQLLRNDSDTATIATVSVSDDATTFVKGADT